jgi:hypothetical protein
MGKIYEFITPELKSWIGQQHVFFVATAPLSKDGHVNTSPKGLDCLRITGPAQVAYMDVTGSGAETIAHLRENGRIVLMFCAFSGTPMMPNHSLNRTHCGMRLKARHFILGL